MKNREKYKNEMMNGSKRTISRKEYGDEKI